MKTKKIQDNQVEEQGLGEEFYELMQAYRSWPLSDQEGVIRAYENVINFIHSEKLKLLDLVEKEVVGEDKAQMLDGYDEGGMVCNTCGCEASSEGECECTAVNKLLKEQRQKLAAIREGLLK